MGKKKKKKKKKKINVSDFGSILPSLYYWPFGGLAFVFGCMSKKQNTIALKWFHRNLGLFEKNRFVATLMTVMDI